MAKRFVCVQVPLVDWASFAVRLAQMSEFYAKKGEVRNFDRSGAVLMLLEDFLSRKQPLDCRFLDGIQRVARGVVLDEEIWRKARKYALDNKMKGGLSAIISCLVHDFNNRKLF